MKVNRLMSMLRPPNPSCMAVRRLVRRPNRKLWAACPMNWNRFKAPAPACSLLIKNPKPIFLSNVGRS